MIIKQLLKILDDNSDKQAIIWQDAVFSYGFIKQLIVKYSSEIKIQNISYDRIICVIADT
jgi:hypothetical protein